MNLSIVIPVYNEDDNLPILHEAIYQALECLPDLNWEVIFVDDGSRDGSMETLARLSNDHQRSLLCGHGRSHSNAGWQ